MSKASEALNSLIALSERGLVPDELSLMRFERAARESLEIDPITANQLLGIVEMHRWSAGGVRAYFGRALDLGADVPVRVNFARALADMNEAEGAAEQMDAAASRVPENLGYLRGAIGYRFCAGHWKRAEELFKILRLRTADTDMEMREFGNVINLGNAIGIREETVRKSVACALQMLSTKRIRAESFSHALDGRPHEECVYLNIEVALSADEARALDDELTPLLFDAVEDPQISSFLLSIRPYVQAHAAN